MKVAIYVRVSTIEQAQEGYSIPAQISLLREYSKTYKYPVYKIYQDAGISGKNVKDRPGLCELINDAKNKKFDMVLVWKLSRLSRSLLDLLELVDIFNKNNISFISYSEKFDTSTPMGKMLLQMLGSIAEFERNTIAENVKMGLNERFKQGYSKGAIPFGYIHEHKQAIIVQEQASIVKYIFETYINTNGNCLTDLAEKLNTEGYKTRTGGLWSRTTIRDMIQNQFYAGYVRTGVHPHGYKRMANAAIIKGTHEPIIDEDTFNKANTIVQAAKQKNIIRYPDNDSFLTGLIVCPLCGAKMFALNTKNKHLKNDGEISLYPVRMYRCNNKDKGKGVCKGIYISSGKIEPQVFELIADYIDGKEYLINSKTITKNHIDTEDKELSQIKKDLKKFNTLKEKYLKLFEIDNIDTTIFLEKINEIQKQIEDLEKKKEKILILNPNEKEDFSILFKDIPSFRELCSYITNPEKKDLMRRIIKSVHITADKVLSYIELTDGGVLKTLS